MVIIHTLPTVPVSYLSSWSVRVGEMLGAGAGAGAGARSVGVGMAWVQIGLGVSKSGRWQGPYKRGQA